MYLCLLGLDCLGTKYYKHQFQSACLLVFICYNSIIMKLRVQAIAQEVSNDYWGYAFVPAAAANE